MEVCKSWLSFIQCRQLLLETHRDIKYTLTNSFTLLGSNISRSTVCVGGDLQISLINTREAGFPRPFVLTIGIPDGTGINYSVDWVTDRWTSNHTLCVCNIGSILVCIVGLQKLMMTSVSYRYSNDDKKTELREVVMDKLASSLTLAFVRTVKWVTSHLLTDATACHSWEERRQLKWMKWCPGRAISRNRGERKSVGQSSRIFVLSPTTHRSLQSCL